MRETNLNTASLTIIPDQVHTYTLILVQILWTRIPDPRLRNRKQAITLRQTRAIINLANPRLPSPFLERQPRRRRVRDDITADRLLRVWIEHRTWASIDLRNDLVRNHHRDAELVCQSLQRAEKFRKVDLPVRELASAGEVRAVKGSGAIDDEE